MRPATRVIWRFLSLTPCLAMRLPAKGSNSQTLKPVDMSKAWLASFLSQTAVPASSYKGNPLEAVWLPNEQVARIWIEYVKQRNRCRRYSTASAVQRSGDVPREARAMKSRGTPNPISKVASAGSSSCATTRRWSVCQQ